jgi:pantetheine-phosphate adenylyltransferase
MAVKANCLSALARLEPARMTQRIAFYAGSFDPLTNGHLDVLKASLSVADEILLPPLASRHPRVPLFLVRGARRVDPQGRRGRVRQGGQPHAMLFRFDGLVVDAARQHGATIMIRGLRDGTDLDYEMSMAGMNETMAPAICRPCSCRPARRCALLPPHWCARSRRWAATSGPFVPKAAVAPLKAKFDQRKAVTPFRRLPCGSSSSPPLLPLPP